MFSLTQYCFDFPILTMIHSKFHFSHIFPTNVFFWTRNKNDVWNTSSILVKCISMIISTVVPSYPNVTLFLCHIISEHWTISPTIWQSTTKLPKPDSIKHNPKNHVSYLDSRVCSQSTLINITLLILHKINQGSKRP